MENYTYRFEELSDALKNSICDIDKVIKEQSELIDDLTKIKKKKYENFINDIRKTIEKYTEQKELLTNKLELTQKIINDLKESNEKVEFLSNLSDCLGIFKSIK